MPAPDYTSRYNTPLDPAEALHFEQWLQTMSVINNRDMSQDLYDYDLQGAFKAGAGQSANMHFPDTFKKPNHPTFSSESIYNGADGQYGGSWTQMGAQRWNFDPGPTNLKFHGRAGLQSYLKRADPDVTLMETPNAGTTNQAGTSP